MRRRPRRNHFAAFKAKVAIAAIKGEWTITQIAEQFDIQAQGAGCHYRQDSAPAMLSSKPVPTVERSLRRRYATEAVRRIDELFAIEREINGLSPQLRFAVRAWHLAAWPRGQPMAAGSFDLRSSG